MKTGIGSASVRLPGGVVVGAIVAVNAFGDVIDPEKNRILAGTRKIGQKNDPKGKTLFANTLESMGKPLGKVALRIATGSNTVIGVVATNAKLTKADATRVAMMAQDGLARVVKPAHTMLDGDTLFALSTGKKSIDLSTVGAYAAVAVEQAILNAVLNAQDAYGLPSGGKE
jgi:L-aminopeptidase/D-esterase-like protein